MQTLIAPFRGLRPAEDAAADVIAPPYDVINSAEASELAKDKPNHFLHVSKPEIDCPPGTDVYADCVYEKGASNLHALIERGILIEDEEPCYYLYRITQGEHQQTGLVAAASVDAYLENRILKHELTRPEKEQDRVRLIEATQAQFSPLLLAFRQQASITQLFDAITASAPIYHDIVLDDTRHTLWQITDDNMQSQLTQAFEDLPAVYIADGHHRSAAAAQVAKLHSGQSAYQRFLTVLFPDTQLAILGYHRVVKDLNGYTPSQFLEQLRHHWQVEKQTTIANVKKPGEFSLYLGQSWYTLKPLKKRPMSDVPIENLDAFILHDTIIAPLLGIHDVRQDKRIDFVGGSRGLQGLMARVDSQEMQVAFAMYPTPLEQLFAVADSGAIMPPKSTWFEPKLADGLIAFRYE